MNRIVLALVVASGTAVGQQVQSVRVNTGATFSGPVFAASAPGTPGTLYVVQQNGQIRPMNTATGAIGSTFLDVPAIVGTANFTNSGERGLLGLAFHPDYAANGKFYVNYSAPGATNPVAVRVDEFTALNGVVDPGSRRSIMAFDTPKAANQTNHNAGWIGFNPADAVGSANRGNLYVATGDSGSGNDPLNFAQSTASLQGKLLRVNVNGTAGANNYTIPTGNMSGAGVLPELYATGLRNPYRASFDRANGNLYIGDVGQSAREEIDFIANGAAGGINFGWRAREGFIQNPGLPNEPVPMNAVDPIHDYARTVGRSVTGGYVYRRAGDPLDGTYFFGDYVDSKVFSFKYDGTTLSGYADRTSELRTSTNGFTLNNVSGFAEDGFGNLYVMDLGGEIFRIQPVPEPATLLIAAAGGLATTRLRRRHRE